MKRKVLRGFTLVECIVAMALIAIASLFMAQIYGSVSKISRNNKMLSTSLQEQMKSAEREVTTASGSIEVVKLTNSDGLDKMAFELDQTSDTASALKSANSNYSKFMQMGSKSNKSAGVEYELYIYKPKDQTTTADGKSYKMDQNVHYKFIIPKT